MSLVESRWQRTLMLCALYVAQGIPWGFMLITLPAYLAYHYHWSECEIEVSQHCASGRYRRPAASTPHVFKVSLISPECPISPRAARLAHASATCSSVTSRSSSSIRS